MSSCGVDGAGAAGVGAEAARSVARDVCSGGFTDGPDSDADAPFVAIDSSTAAAITATEQATPALTRRGKEGSTYRGTAGSVPGARYHQSCVGEMIRMTGWGNREGRLRALPT